MNRFSFPAVVAALAGFALASGASAQNISVVAGNGQVICLGCTNGSPAFFQTMVAKVTDSSGNPVNGASVSWTVVATNGGGNVGVLLSGPTTTSLVDGTTTNVLTATLLPTTVTFQSFLQFTVTATTSTSSAVFVLTQGVTDPFNPQLPPVQVQARNVPISTTMSGPVGSASTDPPIQVVVVDEHGNAIPNVGLFLVNSQDPTQGPIATCPPSPGAGPFTVLTDGTGTASCTPVFGGVPGRGSFQVVVGGGYPNGDTTQPPNFYYESFPINLNITPGVAGAIKIISGSGQSANPGQTLPAPLVVEVDGTGGQPLAGSQINWKVIPSTAASLANSSTTSGSNGQVSNTVTFSSSASGTVQVTATLATDSTKSVTFTENAVVPVSITGFTIFSGNNQSTAVNTAFPQPLVVQVTTSTGSAAGIPVQFAVATGSISLSASTATTDSNGRAQVTVQAGTVTGPASVTASVAAATGVGTQTFTLAVLPPTPTITANNFVSGADYQRGSLSPCAIGAVVVPGGSLGISDASPTFPGLAINLPSVSLTINNLTAPILSVGTNPANQQQITFQVPCEVAPGTVPAVLTVGGGSSTVSLNILAASPGIFQTVMTDGVQRAVIIRPDGSVVSLSNPGRRGELVVAMVTGLGPVSPAVGTGALPAPGSSDTTAPNAPVQYTVVVGMGNGEGVPLTYARLSEDLPGVYLVAFQIPSDLTPGSNVNFSVGVVPTGATTATYANPSKFPVQ